VHPYPVVAPTGYSERLTQKQRSYKVAIDMGYLKKNKLRGKEERETAVESLMIKIFYMTETV
jgi:hypothetical protein